MIVATLVAAFALFQLPGLIVCLILIGFFTGFYIVPLFTLLQHRAPKASKGDLIATSNFINVTGAMALRSCSTGWFMRPRKAGWPRTFCKRTLPTGNSRG